MRMFELERPGVWRTICIAAALVAGCSSSNRSSPAPDSISGVSSASAPRPTPALFHGKFVVLSDTYGLCLPRKVVEGRWAIFGEKEFSSGKLEYSTESGKHSVSFASGPVGLPAMKLATIDLKDEKRRVRAGSYNDLGVYVVDHLAAPSDSQIWIEYAQSDSSAKDAAFAVATNLVACDFMLRPSFRESP